MMRWVASLFSRRRRYDDLSVSIEEHLQEKIDELMTEGLTRKQAEQRARREFGNVSLIEQRSRETWQWQTVESVLADGKLALRRMAKNPGFTAAVVLTLAIGIGANTAVFTVIDSVSAQAVALSRFQQHRLALARCAGCGRPGQHFQRPQSLGLNVSHLFTAQSHLPVPRRVGAANGKRDWRSAARAGANGRHQRRSARDPRGSARRRPLVHPR